MQILQIQQLCISPVASHSTINCLAICIVRYLTDRKKVYPTRNLLPKHHYLVHLPEQIRRFGPSRNHWCMRTERKYSFFKRKKLKNTKNVAFSLASSHRTWMCAQQVTSTGVYSKIYLRAPVRTKSGQYYDIEVYDYGANLAAERLSPNTKVLVVDEVQVNGVDYRKKQCAFTQVQ